MAIKYSKEDDADRALRIKTRLTKNRADPTFPARSTGDPKLTRQFALDAAGSLIDSKCEQLVILDVRKLSPITDFVVIGTGTSDRQMNSALAHVEELGIERGFPAFGTCIDDRSTWLLADFVDVVVHLFEPIARDHYDIEQLWGNAPRIDPPEHGPRAGVAR